MTKAQARWLLPAHASSVPASRHLVRDTLREWNAQDLEDPVLLACSELVTNALVHAVSSPELRLSMDSHRLRMEVEDAASSIPSLRAASADALGGRGLLLVDCVADRWGSITPVGIGKVVWCEFQRSPSLLRPV